MDNNDTFIKYISKVFSSLMEQQIYGSVEIYFEDGRPTQVTHRVINKLGNRNKQNSKTIKPTQTTYNRFDKTLPSKDGQWKRISPLDNWSIFI